MPLELLGPLVVLGIALVVALVSALGLSRPLRFETLEQARAAYLHDHPDDAGPLRGAPAVLAADGSAALFALPGALGVVAALGDGTVTRRLEAGAVRAAAAGGDGLALHGGDFGAPRIRLRFARREDRAAALAMIRRYGVLREA